MLFKDYKIEKFFDELSSELSSPGGGSTAALVLGLSASLNSMVYSLTVNKKAFKELNDKEQEKMLYLQKQSKDLIIKSQEFMEKDREYFLSLMKSYKLPKNNEKEIKLRKEKIREATIKAMEIPLNLAEECVEFYDNIEFAINCGNKNLISDAGVALSLLHAAIESSIINVKVNLSSLTDEDFKSKIEEKINIIIENSYIKKYELMKMVDEIIYPKK